MPTPVFMEGGTDASYGTDFFSTVTGTVTSETTVTNGFPRSIKCDSGASSTANVKRSGIMADAGRRVSFRFRFSALPSGTGTKIVAAETTTTGTYPIALNLRNDGTLSCTMAGTTTNGSTVLSVDTWYRISFSYTITSASLGELRVFIEGTQELSVSPRASIVTGTDALRIGWFSTSPGASVLCYIRDIFVDDGTTLDDPGNIYVTTKLPNATNVNNFDTPVGTGTNRWDYVDERPFSTTNRLTHAATTDVAENFGIQNAATGDVNITGATIVGIMGYVYAAKGTGSGTTAADITVNGVDYAISSTNLTTSYKVFYQPVAASSYPSNAAGIGMRSTTVAPDTLFAEAGMMIAYIPGASATQYTKSVLASLATSAAIGRIRATGKKIVAALGSHAAVSGVKQAASVAPVFMWGGGDWTYDISDVLTPFGGVTIDSTISHTGPCSVKFNTASPAVSATVDSTTGILTAAGARGSLWIYIANYPDVICEFVRIQTSSGSGCLSLGINSTGHLINIIGTTFTGATAIPLNTWHRIAWAYTITSTTVNTLKLYLDGVLQVTASNQTLPSAAPSRLEIGYMDSTDSGINKVCYMDDIFVDAGTDLGDPGDVRIAVKFPASLGSNNDWDTLIGTGANRWNRVAERPLNTTNGISHAGTTQVGEYFGVEGVASGDANLTGATIVGVAGVVQAKVGSGTVSSGSAGPGMMVNGTITNLTLTTTTAFYKVIQAASSYPSGNQAIGMRSNSNSADTFMYECALLVAYIPATTQQFTKALLATQATTARAVKAAGKKFKAAQGQAVDFFNRAGKVIKATQPGVAKLLKRANKPIRATQPSAAAVLRPKRALRAVAAALTSTARLTRQAGKRWVASQATTARFVRSVTAKRRATTAPVAKVVKRAGKFARATQPTTAAITRIKAQGKAILATVALTARNTRRAGKGIRATPALIPRITRAATHSMRATQSSTARVVRRAGKFFRATQGTTNVMRRAVAARRKATVVLVVSVRKTIPKALRGTTALLAAVTMGRHALYTKTVAAVQTLAIHWTRRVQKSTRAPITPVPILRKQAGKGVRGFITVIPRRLNQVGGHVRSVQPLTPRVLKRATHPIRATLAQTGRVGKAAAHTLRATQSSTARMVRQAGRAIRAVEAVSAARRSSVGKRARANQGTTARLGNRQIARLVRAVQPLLGIIARRLSLSQRLTAPLAPVAKVVKRVGKPIPAFGTLVPRMTRRAGKRLLSGQAITVVIRRSARKILAPLLALLPRMTRQGQLLRRATQGITPRLTRQGGIRIRAGQGIIVQMRRQAGVRRRATLALTALQTLHRIYAERLVALLTTAAARRSTVNALRRATQTTTGRVQKRVGILRRAVQSLSAAVYQGGAHTLHVLATLGTSGTIRRAIAARRRALVGVLGARRVQVRIARRAVQGTFSTLTSRQTYLHFVRATLLTTALIRRQVGTRVRVFLTIIPHTTHAIGSIRRASVALVATVRKQPRLARRAIQPLTAQARRSVQKRLRAVQVVGALFRRVTARQIRAVQALAASLATGQLGTQLVHLVAHVIPQARVVKQGRKTIHSFGTWIAGMRKQQARTLVAALAVHGALHKRAQLTRRAIVTTAAAMRRQGGIVRRAFLPIVPARSLQARKRLQSFITIIPRVGRTFQNILRATLVVTAPAMRRAIAVQRRAVQPLTGAFRRRIDHILRVTQMIVSRSTRQVRPTFRAPLSSTARVRKGMGRVVRAVVSLHPALFKGLTQRVRATLLTTGALRRGVRKSMNAGLNSWARLQKRVTLHPLVAVQGFLARVRSTGADHFINLVATLTSAAGVRKRPGVHRTAAQPMQAAFGPRGIGKQIHAVLTLPVTIRKAMARSIRAALHFVVQYRNQLRPRAWIASVRFVRIPAETRQTMLNAESRLLRPATEARSTTIPAEIRQSSQTE